MELSSQEGEIPIPINSSYVGGHGHGHGHMIHHVPAPHNHIIPSSQAVPIQITTSNGPIIPTTLEDHVPYNNNNSNSNSSSSKRMVKYKECLKNHAASMGGNATDGCGEFMPSGDQGTLEALTCSACNCHRNFHRKETEGDHHHPISCDHHYYSTPRVGRKFFLGGHHHKAIMGPEGLGYPTAPPPPPPPPPPHHQMIMSYKIGSLPTSDQSDDQEDHNHGFLARPHHQMVKKRFRTKFTPEQKEKMLNFAEKVGWKIQKQEEAVVQQVCQEIGVKRRVLKVWMHNNKHSLAKKSSSTSQDQM